MLGCSERNTSQNDAAAAPIVSRAPKPEPPKAIVRRTAIEVAELIHGTCLRAAYESASADRFEAIVRERGLNPAPKPDRGRLKVWEAPGVEVAYSGKPKGDAEGVLCHLKFDPRGIPKAKQVVRAIQRLLGKGEPATFRTVEPSGPLGYRWEFSGPTTGFNDLKIGNVPELCDHELGCDPPVLDVLLYHAKNADSR